MKSIKIKIYNREYNIKTDADEEYIHSLASFLEERLKENTSQVIDLNIPYPLLLAVFQIADDFFRTKTELEEFKKRAEDRSKQLVRILDDALKNGDTYAAGPEEEVSEVREPESHSNNQQEELFK